MSTQRPVALVTGGGTGIGRAAVIALAKAGHDVIINYSRSEGPAKETAAEAAKHGAKTLLCECDVADEAGVKGMFADIEKTFGRLDVLINNAGYEIFAADLIAINIGYAQHKRVGQFLHR